MRNKERLRENCLKVENGVTKAKTKTTYILGELDNENYTRKPMKEIMYFDRSVARVIILSRFGMLECGRNFKGTLPEKCMQCNELDNENHRLNHCVRWKHANLYNEAEKVPFEDIFSNDVNTIKNVVDKIKRLWNVGNGNGSMRQQQ